MKLTLRAIRLSLTALAACLILVGPSLAPVQAQSKDAKSSKPTTKDLIRKAIEAYNNDNFTGATRFLEDALKQDPKDRPALYILSVISSVGADKAKTEDYKLMSLRKSITTFSRLRDEYKTLSPEEAKFAPQVQLNEARVLAIEDKPKPALDLIVKLFDEGFSDYDAIEGQPDLKAVRSLPEYREKMDKAVLAGVKADIAKNESFPFDFDLKDVDGKAVKLADFKGNVTIVDVWGTWCPPCRMEIPHFVELAAKYDAKGLKIVGINCNEEGSPAEVKKTIKDFIASTKIPYPCVLDDEKTDSKIPGFQGYPTTLFLDRTGKVRLVLVGYTPMGRLDAIVSTLLAEPTP